MIRKNANRQKLQLKDLSSIRWRQLSADLDRLRRKTKPISTKEIVRLIARDRGR